MPLGCLQGGQLCNGEAKRNKVQLSYPDQLGQPLGCPNCLQVMNVTGHERETGYEPLEPTLFRSMVSSGDRFDFD